MADAWGWSYKKYHENKMLVAAETHQELRKSTMNIDDEPAAIAAPAAAARAKRAYTRHVRSKVASRTRTNVEGEVSDGMPKPVIARAPIRTDVRERKRKNDTSTDIFAIPAHLIPPGTSLEWKRESVLGAEDPHYQVMLHEQGWRPVDVSMIPELMPAGYSGRSA